MLPRSPQLGHHQPSNLRFYITIHTSTDKLQNFVMDVSKKGRVHNNDASVISLCEICINDYLHFLRISQNISRTFHPNPYLCIWLHLTCLHHHHHHIITSAHLSHFNCRVNDNQQPHRPLTSAASHHPSHFNPHPEIESF